MNIKLFYAFFLISTFITNFANAYLTTSESGELVKPGQYRFGVIPQLRMSDGSGTNLSGFIDTPFNDESSIRAQIGFGETDVEAAASYKWIPIPDYDNQPAIGGKVEASFARKGNVNINSIRFLPLISKSFDSKQGVFIPYGSVPISLMNSSTTSATAVQLVVGSEYVNPDNKNWVFSAELGLNFSNAFTYISGAVTYVLEDIEITPRKRKK